MMSVILWLQTVPNQQPTAFNSCGNLSVPTTILNLLNFILYIIYSLYGIHEAAGTGYRLLQAGLECFPSYFILWIQIIILPFGLKGVGQPQSMF